MKTLSKLTLILSLTCTNLLANAQKSKKFVVNNFNSIRISNGIDLYLTQANNEGVVLKSEDEKILNEVLVENDGAHLTIKFKDGFKLSNLFSGRNAKAYVSFKILNAIAASGGSDVFSQNQIKTDKFSIQSSGGSDLKLDINCKNLSIQSSGGSDLKLKGNSTNLTIQSSGGSDIDAYNLAVDYAKVSSSGGSDVKILVNKGLDANASGGSDVYYKGDAALKKANNSRSGSVKHVN